MSTQAGENSGSSSSFIPSAECPILVTDSAAEAMLNAVKQDGEAGDGIRVSVVGGGCSGYQYNLEFGELKVFIDSVSAGYLSGTVVDYVAGLQGTGFKFNNPNAKRTCGCGSSFS